MQSCAKFRIVTEQNTQFNDVIVSNSKKKLREWQKILYQAFIFIYIQTHAFWVCCFFPIFFWLLQWAQNSKSKIFQVQWTLLVLVAFIVCSSSYIFFSKHCSHYGRTQGILFNRFLHWISNFGSWIRGNSEVSFFPKCKNVFGKSSKTQ